MMRRIAGFLCIVLLLCMTGCAGSKLSDAFDKEEVTEKAKALIERMNAGEAREVWQEEFGAMLKTAITEEDWVATMEPIIEELGAFESYDKEAVAGSKDPDTEEEFATAIIVAKYENGKSQYTISFNESMAVTGFFIK